MNVTSKIIGLIRGDNGAPNELILEGGTRVVLPEMSPWAWDDIHLVLEAPNWIEGSLIRVPNSNKWTVGAETKLTSQRPLA